MENSRSLHHKFRILNTREGRSAGWLFHRDLVRVGSKLSQLRENYCNIVSSFPRATVDECCWLVKTSSLLWIIVGYVDLRNTLYTRGGWPRLSAKNLACLKSKIIAFEVHTRITFENSSLCRWYDGVSRVDPHFVWRLGYSRDGISWLESPWAFTETF